MPGILEKPLPKPKSDPLGYASARLLEALLEAVHAIRLLREGYTRNAAGKAFQAWKALIAALLAVERDALVSKLGVDERWLDEVAILRIPTSKLRSLARLLEGLGYRHILPLTDIALNLHDYQYHGPDTDMALSRYTSEDEARKDVTYLLRALAELVERVKPSFSRVGLWRREHEDTLTRLRRELDEIER